MSLEKLKHRRAAMRRERRIRSERVKSLLLERGISVFRKYGISKVVVFGSVSDGTPDTLSDVDLLVMPLKNIHYWDFRHELEEEVDLPIDLYTDLDDADFVDKILDRGETIYEV